MIREFYPHEIKSKIRVYLNGKEIKPLFATLICMSDQPNTEVTGYIDLIELVRDENGNAQYNENGLPIWKPKSDELVHDVKEANRLAEQLNLAPIKEPLEPEIKRHHGKIKWELVK